MERYSGEMGSKITGQLTLEYVQEDSMQPFKKSKLLSARQRAALRREQLADMPTQITRVVRPFETEPILPLDAQGRPYVRIESQERDTLKLVEQAVDQYVRARKTYPSVILLSAIRFLEIGFSLKYYYPLEVRGLAIPYRYDPAGAGYDVLCR
ncbi:hypothetical protein KTH_40880 [Thermosporothrix hazakensis]|jgi:hypothetical protein|nr:hypothetical protein KTH_40880 [Thermosporothrix hazakensis]